MSLVSFRRFRHGSGALVALAVLAACAGDPISPSATSLTETGFDPSFLVANGDAPQTVEVCTVGPAGTSNVYTVSADNNGGSLTIGSPTPALIAYPTLDEVNASGCVTVWRAIYPNSPTNGAFTNVTVTSVTPGATLLRIVAYDQPGGGAFREQWLEPAPASNAATVNVNYDYGARIYFKFDAYIPPPPPPPSTCDGLTPGYWKNWSNHYTAAQFTTLLAGTIAGSITQANAILSYEGNDAIGKLRKFILANQLTLNLVANPGFPNPDGAFLNAACTSSFDSTTLGTAMQRALAMHANPSGYSKGAILSVKDILDQIANLND